MANASFNKSLCMYIITKEQANLMSIYQTFGDYISDDESNPYFIQSDILDKILTNIEECQKEKISFSQLYKDCSKSDKEDLASLNLNEKILKNAHHSNILEIDYFDEETFLNLLSEEIEDIFDRYNLEGKDDHNKFQLFLRGLESTLEASDDVMSELSHQYVEFKNLSKLKDANCNVGYITVYGKKIYKFDILKKLMEQYQDKICPKNETLNKVKKKSR